MSSPEYVAILRNTHKETHPLIGKGELPAQVPALATAGIPARALALGGCGSGDLSTSVVTSLPDGDATGGKRRAAPTVSRSSVFYSTRVNTGWCSAATASLTKEQLEIPR